MAGAVPGHNRPGASTSVGGTPSGAHGAAHAHHHEANARIATARAYLSGVDIPPADIGGYGIVAFKNLPTALDKDRLIKLCQAFIAAFPRQKDLPPTVDISDQMLTIWPLVHPHAREAEADSCPFLTTDYDLYAGQSAIADARRQKANMDGAGPFLIAWSPSSTRGVPDKIVLVYDLSKYDSLASFEMVFGAWTKTITTNPQLWRNGWTMAMRLAIARDFFDRFADQALEAIHIRDKNGKVGGAE